MEATSTTQYPFRNFLLLFGASAKAEVMNYVRTECISEEEERLQQILVDWVPANQHFKQLEQSEQFEPENIDIQDIPDGVGDEVKRVEDDPLFRQAFSMLPYEVKLVEIDRLVAGQRAVNLDYVEELKRRVPKNPTAKELIDICLAPPKDITPPAEQLLVQNVLSFTSENLDFRFLGGFRKPLTQDDIAASTTGGLPTAAIVLLVGLGSSSMNCLEVNNRVVLNNGFHRAYALRSMGVTHIPLVVQKVTNPQLEFPQVIANLPREYLLGVPRPALVKDFRDTQLTKQLRVKARNKIVQVQWAASQFALPIVG